MKKFKANNRADREEKRIVRLFTCAGNGDSSASSELRELFDAKPTRWETVGNMAIQAECSLVKVASGDNEVLEEAIYKKLNNMKKDLAGSAPTPLERLLVERVVACWFQVHYADITYTQHMNKLSLEQGNYYQQRQDRAHRRYMSAIRTLAQVRRLLIPSVQVNIGNQQVNAAQVSV